MFEIVKVSLFFSLGENTRVSKVIRITPVSRQSNRYRVSYGCLLGHTGWNSPDSMVRRRRERRGREGSQWGWCQQVILDCSWPSSRLCAVLGSTNNSTIVMTGLWESWWGSPEGEDTWGSVVPRSRSDWDGNCPTSRKGSRSSVTGKDGEFRRWPGS